MKNYRSWHNKKEKLENISERPFFHEREVWYCYLGANVGFEQDGQGEDFLRPVIIIKKFNNEIFWGIPLTKSNKKLNKNNEKYYYDFDFTEDVKSRAILSQLRLIDSKRLGYRFREEMQKEDYCDLIKKLKELFP